MTKLYISNTSVDEFKDQIYVYGKDKLGLDGFEFYIRSYNVEGTNDHLIECVFHEDYYDLFDIEHFIQTFEKSKTIGYCLSLPDGSPVFKAWDKGDKISDICEPENKFEVSDSFGKVFPNVSNFDEFNDEADRRWEADLDEMLVALMKELLEIDSNQSLLSPQEQLFSVSEFGMELVSDFEISDYGDCIEINGTDFNYWS